MKTYTVTQTSQALVTVKVRAKNADEANDIAMERIHQILQRLERPRKYLNFGDISDDYLPARDD